MPRAWPRRSRQIAPDEARAEAQRRERAVGAQQVHGLAAGHHHAAEQHELGQRPGEAREVGAEQPAVERQGLERAQARRGAGLVLAVVGRGEVGAKADVGALLEVLDHARRVVEKGPQQRRIGALADQPGEIALGLLAVVRDAAGAQVVVVGDPERARGARAGAADARGVLEHDRREARERRGQRRGQPGRAAAQHDQIGGGRLLHLRPALPARLSKGLR